MSMYRNLMTVCCAAVLALGLAACGGSDKKTATVMDDDDGMEMPMPTGPTPEETTKAAGTKAKAIGKVGPDNMPLADVDVTVTAKRTGPDIKVEGDDDFTHVMGPMYRLEHAADDDGNVAEEIVLVDHTISSPKGMGFTKVHELNARDLDTAVDADADGTADNDYTALLVVADNFGKVMAGDFAAGASTTTVLTFDADDDSTSATNEAAMVDGTYDGAPGTYVCTGDTDCTVSLNRDAKGKVTLSSTTPGTDNGGWIFIPDDGARVYVVDTEYASYGIWLKRTTDSDGVLTYNMVDTFAMGTPATTAIPATVRGTASYEGSALGVYVHNVLDSGGEIASATGGMFTADAALTASFNQTVDDSATTPANEADQIAPAHLNTITGTIDNFELEGGEAQSWSVELLRSATYDTTVTDTVRFSGATKGGGENGAYSGQFYGGTGDASDAAPGTDGGEFTANFLNGHVAGGFGATKQKD